jgi:hypothetical protein
MSAVDKGRRAPETLLGYLIAETPPTTLYDPYPRPQA